MNKGLMISIEGNDGAGKTTAANALLDDLKSRGIDAILTREPGGSPVAEQIRSVLLQPENAMDARTEALLYAASRREHLIKTILPALEAGKIVLCDRFLDSSLAYQGEGRNLGMEEIEALNDFGLQGFRPDLTLFFSVDLETGKKRMHQRGELNRLDQESQAFHARVRDGFEKLIEKEPERFVRIDASQSRQQTARDAADAVSAFLKRNGYGQ